MKQANIFSNNYLLCEPGKFTKPMDYSIAKP